MTEHNNLKARDLVLRFGWNSHSYQVLNPGIEKWFCGAGNGIVGYVRRRGVRVTVGGPVCDTNHLAATAAEFEEEAARSREHVCYFAAQSRLHELYRSSRRHSTVLLGAQPVWDPAGWPASFESNRSLRAMARRALNKGVVVQMEPSSGLLEDTGFRACVESWLKTRPLPPMGFLVEARRMGGSIDRRFLAAFRNKVLVGTAVLSPIASRNGWLVEHIVRRPDAPNGTGELLIDGAMRWMSGTGARYATLGLAPLAVRPDISYGQNPGWINILFKALRNFGGQFYNFEGLEAFKTKLRPAYWEPMFAISNESRFSVRTLQAAALAFAGPKPGRVIRTVLREVLSFGA